MRWLIFVIALIGVPAFAVQKHSAADGDTIHVTVSKRDSTRITMSGQRRLSKLWGVEGVLDVVPDKSNGDAYIHPLAAAKETFTFFIKDNQGAVYTIVATQSDVPSETIIIEPKGQPQKISGDAAKLKNAPYRDQINAVMRSLALAETPDNYDCHDENVEVKLWKETQIILQRKCHGNFLAEVYLVRNKTKEKVVLEEREFLDFGAGVRAIAVHDKHALTAGEETRLFVVRSAED